RNIDNPHLGRAERQEVAIASMLCRATGTSTDPAALCEWCAPHDSTRMKDHGAWALEVGRK
ncbi:MAG: hypothetical protein AAF347_11875, partial [Pseudomonadota bacterium]